MYSGSVASTGTQSRGAAAASAGSRSWSRPAQRRDRLLALQDQAGVGLVRRHLDREVEQRLVFHHAARLQSARGRNDHPGFGVGDAGRQFRRRETAEHDGVDGAQTGTGQHGDGCFGNHRHVDHDAVAQTDAQIGERSGEFGGAVAQLRIRMDNDLAGHRAVPDQRGLLAAAGFDMAVEAVVTGVEHAAGEPLAIGAHRGVEHPVPALRPGDALGRVGPPGLGVAVPVRLGFVIGHGSSHGVFSRRFLG